tara:strand:- start:748 stop:1677 length:930 start_codon:yes stop_codon:yes gene_type:complete
MFSIIFPGQGSQIVGMAKEFYENYDSVKKFFENADEILNKSLSKLILEGPKDILDQTENTQPAIFLVSYSIFKVLEKEVNFDLNKASFFAGHSLGEYSALCCADSLDFEQTISLLKYRGIAMQNAIPRGQGAMIATLGIDINEIRIMLKEIENKHKCYIANDNSIGQVVLSGKTDSIEFFSNLLKDKKIKFVKLPVSAPFHCPLMNKATIEMKQKILATKFNKPKIDIVSNVTANPINSPEVIKKLLIEQIEQPVRWRESVTNMLNSGISKFIEIGPGKVLSGLIKRIDRNVKLNQVNNITDIKNLTND